MASLYRTLLKREPDGQEIARHAADLREHGEAARIVDELLLSQEFLETRQRKVGSALDGDRPTFVSEQKPEQETFDTDHLIECSRDHFADVSFLDSLSQRTEQFGRKKRPIRTIAVYYPKMNNGGTERVTSRQILAWTELGYKVVLITDLPRDESRDYEYGDVKRFLVPPKMMDNHDYRPRGRALANILIDQSVDVFVNNLWDETSTVWDVLVAKVLGIPVVVGWHNIFDTRIRNPGDLHLANTRFSGYKYADLVTVLSTVDKLWFNDRGITARVVYNPLTFDALPSTTSPLNGKTLIWVARAERHQKRLDLAIRMFPLVLEKVPDAKLVIVGGGPDLAWAKEYARALGIAQRVEFTGYTTDVAKHLARSDIHILTSEFEGWCLAIGEAWAFGVPSVMFELPNIEYVQSGRGFIAVEMLDISAMATAVVDLLLDDEKRRKLGREARRVIEEFDQVSVKEEWRKIFEDIETKDDLDTPLSPEAELRGRRVLNAMLGERFLSLEGNRADQYIPILPSEAPVLPPRTVRKLGRIAKKMPRPLLMAVRGLIAPVIWTKQLISRSLAPDRRLRMIDLSHVGLGDNVMIWTGLFTLLNNGVPLCAPGCVIHVQPILADLAEHLFARFGLVVQRGRPERQLRPIYSPLPPANWRQAWATYVGPDWRMNWVEALDQQKTFPRRGADVSFLARLRLHASERVLYGRDSWAHATPGYVGYRVWLPVALRYGVYPIMFLSQLKRSLPAMREIVADYVDSITPVAERSSYSGNAAFPTGKSFQTIPPETYAEIDRGLGGDFFTCFVQNDSPWYHDYEKAGVKTTSLSDLKDTLRLLKYSKALLTTDSFTSHVAQLLKDDFVLVLSRDMPESIVHPGSRPTIVANHPACAPCNYQERYHYDRCVAGYKSCIAFANPAFVEEITSHFRSAALKAAAESRSEPAAEAPYPGRPAARSTAGEGAADQLEPPQKHVGVAVSAS